MLVILSSGVVAAIVSALLGLGRDWQTGKAARLDKHRDRIQAAVADFLAADHARHRVAVEIARAQAVVDQDLEDRLNAPAYKSMAPSGASLWAKDKVAESRPILNARSLETDQAVARVELLDLNLGALARKVAEEAVPDKHAEAVEELVTTTQKAMNVPGAKVTSSAPVTAPPST